MEIFTWQWSKSVGNGQDRSASPVAAAAVSAAGGKASLVQREGDRLKAVEGMRISRTAQVSIILIPSVAAATAYGSGCH